MNKPGFLKNSDSGKLYSILVCLILFVLVIILRTRVLYDFCFIITDSDQLLLWDAANDMHHGIFHEPCFYGQSYNPLIEPLFSQLFLFLGMGLRFAVPLVSWIFGLFPFLLLGWVFFKRKMYYSTAFTFAYLLWLPIEFHAIDSIPRGFVPSCAFAALGIYIVLFSQNRLKFFWFGFLSLLAITISQNCIFLIVPAVFYIWFTNFKSLKFYSQSAAGFLAALPFPLFIYWFYATHPAYNLHDIEYTFDFDTFQQSLKQTDQIFNFLVPIQRGQFMILNFIYFIFIAICLKARNFKAVFAIITGLMVLYFSLWFDKAQDVESNLFFSGVRMYLGVPLSFILFAYWGESTIKSGSFRFLWKFIILSILLFAGVICMFERNRYFKTKLYSAISNTSVVPSSYVDTTKSYCDQLKYLCKANHSNLVILDDEEVGIDYMSPALNYPYKILRPSYERRTWDLKSEDTTIRSNFLYMPAYPDSVKIIKSTAYDIQHSGNDTIFLVLIHGRRVFDVLKDLHVEIRYH